MEFSILGTILAAVLLAPSLLFAVLPPQDKPAATPAVPALLVGVERAGQAACLVALVFSGTAVGQDLFLILTLAAIAAYYCVWLRYFLGGRSFALAFGPLWSVPVPLAILPVLAFLFAGLWSGSIWLLLAALLLGIGHIPASWLRARA